MDASYLDLVMAQQDEALEEVEGGGGVWVVADLAEGRIAPVTLEAIGAARTLADSLGAYVYAVLVGDEVSPLADTLYHAGADGVRVLEHAGLAVFAAEPYTEVLTDLFEEEDPEIVLLGATDDGQALAPRLAQRIGGGLIEHVTSASLDETTRAVKASVPVYGGEYFEIRMCSEARPQVLTLEPGAFTQPFLDEYRAGEPVVREAAPSEPSVRVLGPAEGFRPPAVSLCDAQMVVAGGRQARRFELVEELAEALHAHLAGDRGVWELGLVDAEQMVDVRGATISPEVYVAVGVRGDTFHNAAMEDARLIIAIHPDPDAPIFEIADLCVKAEVDEVLPLLLEMLG
ncbi:MAG: electron transfer flavoprotein subunit alpha/FixB family protein [Chloroflexota bacterium]